MLLWFIRLFFEGAGYYEYMKILMVSNDPNSEKTVVTGPYTGKLPASISPKAEWRFHFIRPNGSHTPDAEELASAEYFLGRRQPGQ